MTTTNYLDLDIDKLFEEHTIKEIEEIQKKIQQESDRKKIELRTLVGERYRDLILAADTIAKMKVTSERFISKIINIEDKFQELRNKYLIGFKIEPVERDLEKNSEGIRDSVIIQIKILMDIPQHIWSSIENKDLLFATQLYLVAQHVNYSLRFEVGELELAEKYPIVSKQWDVVGEFKHIIFNKCNQILCSLDVQPESAANCLAALVLLNNTPLKQLLQKLISMRSCALESVIKDDNDDSVKNKIRLCIKILIETVILIYTCFIKSHEDSSGLVSHYVTEVQDQEAYLLFCRLDINQDLLDEYLPSVAKCHRPFAQDTQDNFSLVELQENVKTWLEWINEFCGREVTKLLNLIVSVRGLYNVREEAIGINLPENWNSIWEELGLPKVSFWVEFFQPMITKRAKSIISDKWSESFFCLKTNVSELLDKMVHDKFEYPEHDLRWFVWKDSPNDIPQKLTKNGLLDNKRSLLMKTKGYSPNLVKLCQVLDESLYSLLSDLEQYLYETERTVTVKDEPLSTRIFLVSNTFSDRSEVQEHLQTVSCSRIEEFVDFVKKYCVSEKPEHGRKDVNAIVLARFLLALTTLSVNLNKCFTLSQVTMTNLKWQSVCDKLKEESTFLWSIWAKAYRSRIQEHRRKIMAREPLDGLRIQLIISEWEKVTIEEDSGEGKRIKSEILVPYQPSIRLQKFLTAVAKDLNRVVPHTLPRKVLYEIVESVAKELLDYCLEVSNSADLRQKQAIQVLFDVKYCTLLMVPRENKALVDLSSRATEGLLAKIDPFDYDVFDPFISTNVKKSVQRSLLIFGNLVPHLEQLHSILGARGDYGGAEGGKSDPPSVLALCTESRLNRWIEIVALEVRKKPTTKESGKNESAGATIKSGAAAFFGAMGSDWFSSG
ncbi:hypothetical protein KM043_001141 [Ampulex compressa]|nr:hypothetical protein KM043_001141 [Ampulex compressa]